jgi:hypothetical protein
MGMVAWGINGGVLRSALMSYAHIIATNIISSRSTSLLFEEEDVLLSYVRCEIM